MKKFFAVTLLTFMLFTASALPTSAHPGRTDSNGGHWDRSNRTYHYHNGEYAGQTDNSSNNTTSYSGSIDWDKIHKAAQEKDRERQTTLANVSASSITESSVNESTSNTTKQAKHHYGIFDIFSIAFMIAALIFFIVLFVFTYIYPLFSIFFKKIKKKKFSKTSSPLPNNFAATDNIFDIFSESSPEVSEDEIETSNPRISNYKSLIPELETNTKNTYLIIDSDIPIDKTFFSPINIEDPAFVRVYTANGKESYDFPIFKYNQYITLMKGEKIELINCYINSEE